MCELPAKVGVRSVVAVGAVVESFPRQQLVLVQFFSAGSGHLSEMPQPSRVCRKREQMDGHKKQKRAHRKITDVACGQFDTYIGDVEGQFVDSNVTYCMFDYGACSMIAILRQQCE